jgi:hypothetical protein
MAPSSFERASCVCGSSSDVSWCGARENGASQQAPTGQDGVRRVGPRHWCARRGQRWRDSSHERALLPLSCASCGSGALRVSIFCCRAMTVGCCGVSVSCACVSCAGACRARAAVCFERADLLALVLERRRDHPDRWRRERSATAAAADEGNARRRRPPWNEVNRRNGRAPGGPHVELLVLVERGVDLHRLGLRVLLQHGDCVRDHGDVVVVARRLEVLLHESSRGRTHLRLEPVHPDDDVVVLDDDRDLLLEGGHHRVQLVVLRPRAAEDLVLELERR